ncbi:MAG: hypothetical protein AAFY48_07790 [Bacteroidota bacterium]
MSNINIKNKIGPIFLVLLLTQSFINAQSQASFSVDEQRVLAVSTSPIRYFSFTQSLNNWKLALPRIAPSSSEVAPPPLLSNFQSTQSTLPAYNVDHLAFFCRLEVHLEKATKIPVRFRLGDVQQVDYLEGKFTGWRYGY